MITVTNTTNVQSVWSKNANALGVAFYSAGQAVSVNTSVTGLSSTLTVSVANPCLVLLVKSQSGWKLSVSDPTNGNLTSTTVTVNGVAHSVTFPTGNYKGQTVTISI